MVLFLSWSRHPIKIIFFSFMVVFSLSLFLPSGALAWVNTGFETGDTSGWTIQTGTGTYPSSAPYVNVVGPGAALLTNGTAFGNPAICPAPTICLNQVNSGNYAAVLYSGWGDEYHEDWSSIQQTDTVPANQTVLTVWFAAVLEGYHYLTEDTSSQADSLVQFDILLGAQTVYTQQYSWYVDYPPPDVTAPLVPPLMPPIYPVTLVYDGDVDSGVTWAHLPWTQYVYDFGAYVGQQVTIKYTAFDCEWGGHFCYGYLV